MTTAGRTGPATFEAIAVAILLAVASAAGIFVPSIYAKETASWAAQGIGQDWVDLVVVAPGLTAAALAARRGSRRGVFLQAGALLYVVYSFLIYAFFVHFNALFLVYCAILGLSAFALAGTGAALLGDPPHRWFDAATPVRPVAGFQLAVAAVFALLWLGEVIPALLRGAPPDGLAEVGLVTNPVQVLDLSLALPLMIVSAIWLLGRRPLGFALVPITLGFGSLMTIALEGMWISMGLRGLEIAWPALTLTTIVLAGNLAALGWLLAHVEGSAPHRPLARGAERI